MSIVRAIRRGRAGGALGLALLTGAGAARAGVINGGFETGDFSGFARAGNTSIRTAAFGSGPTEGTFDALLSTATGAADAASLDVFLGLATGALEAQGFASGSAIKQTFAANAGDPLAFDVNFLTGAPLASTGQAAFAFVARQGGGGAPTMLLLATPADATDTSATGFARETGFQTFNDVVPATGTYTIEFGVFSAANTTAAAGLLVDNLRVAGSTGGGGGSNVPLPAAPLAAAVAAAVARRAARKLKHLAPPG